MFPEKDGGLICVLDETVLVQNKSFCSPFQVHVILKHKIVHIVKFEPQAHTGLWVFD